MNDPGKKCFTVDVRKLALGIFYLLLIAVVFYGMNDHVYDGFGNGVPWIIIVLFFLMGLMRIVEAVTGKNVYEWLRGSNALQSQEKPIRKDNDTE